MKFLPKTRRSVGGYTKYDFLVKNKVRSISGEYFWKIAVIKSMSPCEAEMLLVFPDGAKSIHTMDEVLPIDANNKIMKPYM